MFDLSVFNSAETAAMFYKFMAELRESAMDAQPTPTHRLLVTMKNHKSLLRAYTQNIDGLEARAGLNLAPTPLSNNDALQLHGDIHTLKCFLCSERFHYTMPYTDTFKDGRAPDCPTCADKCAMRVALGRRAMAIGTLRPDVVLYGENHPAGDQIGRACSSDLKKKPDCLVIVGTSLKVPGLKKLIKDFARAVHAQNGKVIFVNMTDAITSEWTQVIDYYVEGRSDDFVALLKSTRPAFFTKQSTLTKLKIVKNSKTQTVVKDRKQTVQGGRIDLSVSSDENCTHGEQQSAVLRTAVMLPNIELRVKQAEGLHDSAEEKENCRPAKRRFSQSSMDRPEDKQVRSSPRKRCLIQVA